MGYVGKNPNFNTTILNNQGAGGVPNAPTGKLKIINRDGTLFTIDDTGTEKEIGSGAGGVNYVTNPNAEINVTDGVSATAITVAAETGSPLEGDQSFQLTSTAAVGEVDWAIDITDPYVTEGGIMLGVRALLRTDNLITEGDFIAGIYNVTDGEYTNGSQDLKVDSLNILQSTFVALAGKTYVFRVEFTDTTAGRNVVVDDIKVTPDSSTALLDHGTDWESYTPTFAGFGSPTGINIEKKRIGDSLLVRGYFTIGTVTAVEAELSLPSGLTVGGSPTATVVAGSYGLDNATVGNTGYALATAGDTFVNFAEQDVRDSSHTNALVPRLGTSAFPSSTRMSVEFMVPIAEWADSQVNLITPNLLKSNIRSKYGFDNVSLANGGYATFDSTPIYNQSGFTLANSDTEIIVPATGKYDISVNVKCSLGAAAGAEANGVNLVCQGGAITVFGSNSTASQNQSYIISTVLELNQGDDVRVQNQSGQTITGWNSNSFISVTRVADVGAHEPVGFGLATTDQAGLNFNGTYQKKTIASAVQSDGTFMTFSSLEVGATYKYTGLIHFVINDGASDRTITCNVVHNGVDLSTMSLESGAGFTDSLRIPATVVDFFEAQATTLTIEAVSASVNSYIRADDPGGNGSGYFILEKISDKEVTTIH